MSWTHKGVAIDIDIDGRFDATIEDITISEKSLEEAKSRIDKELAGSKRTKLNLPVIGILTALSHWERKKLPLDGTIGTGTLIGINRTSRALVIQGVPKGYDLEDPMPDSQICWNHLTTYIKAKAEWEALERKHRGLDLSRGWGYGRLELAEYEEKVLELQARYRLAAEGKPSK